MASIIWRGTNGFYRRGSILGTDVAVAYPAGDGWEVWVADGPPGGRVLPGIHLSAEVAMEAAEQALGRRDGGLGVAGESCYQSCYQSSRTTGSGQRPGSGFADILYYG